MPIMIPTTLAHVSHTTAGERKLFDILQNGLPEACVVRYEILLGERYLRPDFTIIDPARGVQIVEVKDWGVSSITAASIQQFFIVGMGGNKTPLPQRNPGLKCEIYVNIAQNQLVAMPTLVNKSGHLVLPVSYFVAFPNISRQEFNEGGYDKLIVINHVLLREDLVATGGQFTRRYHQALPLLEKKLTDEQLSQISAALLPDIAIPHVTPGFELKDKHVVAADQQTITTYNLSLDQELIAKSLGEGPRLLRGIAGTGKTLIMLYRAKMVASNKVTARILILCWNVSLANYMRQVYDGLRFEAKGHVDIQNFSEFARDLVKKYKGEDFDFDDPRFREQLEKLIVKPTDQYDAIYIDEAQDFRSEWIAVLYGKMLNGNPEERNLLIAADDAQRIYQNRDFRWSDLGIPMIGRSKILRTVHRNSAKIWLFSALLLGGESAGKAIDTQEVTDKLKFASIGGFDPQLIECATPQMQINKAVEIVEALLHNQYSARNVLILYRHKRTPGFNWIRQLQTSLQSRHIAFDWIAADGAKNTFDWSDDTVKISSVHSAKEWIVQ